MLLYTMNREIEERKSMRKRVETAALATQRHDWEQGVVAQAFLESGDRETAFAMAVEAVNRQLPDGRCAQIGGGDSVTDPCAIGEVLVEAAESTGDERLTEAKDRLLRWALETAPRNREGILYHLGGLREFWADSFYNRERDRGRSGCSSRRRIQL